MARPTASIKKIGRHHHIVVNGRSVARRRSEDLAFKFLRRVYFKPVSRYQLDGSVGTSCGYRWFERENLTSRGEDHIG